MAIAFGACRQTLAGGSSPTSPVTWTSQTVSGSNTYGIVNIRVSNGGDLVTSVTWNGSSMTRAQVAQSPSSTEQCYMYYIIAPAAGGTTVSVSFSGSPNAVQCIDAYYTGVAQTAPDSITTAQTGTNTSQNLTYTNSASTWLLGTHQSQNFNSNSHNGTQRFANSDATDLLDTNGAAVSANDSTSIGWGWAGSDNHSMVGISIIPATAAATNSGFLMFM